MLVIVISNISNTNIMAEGVEISKNYIEQYNIYKTTELVLNFGMDKTNLPVNTDLREQVIKCILSDQISLEERFNIATLYNMYFAENSEEMVLLLLAYEISKNYDAKLVPAFNSYLI